MLAPSVFNVLARYKEKKEVPKADGSGTTTVYVYGPRQVAERNRAKAERVENLRNSIDKLREKYEKDLKSDDASTRLTALAVALIDHTYERVGNDSSAENGHFGVTGWQVDHISFSKGKATLEYVGKSGVDHKKVVDDKALVDALKKATEGKKGKDKILCDGEDCSVTSTEVNAYLKEFDITAKDIRGLHANEEVKAALKKVRSKGGDLPKDRKEKDKILKAELKEALEIAAEAVGHEASTLKNQYLVPGLVDSYLHDGTVLDKLYEKKSSMRTAAFDICAHCPRCQGILMGGKFYDGCSDCGYEVNLIGFGGWPKDPCNGKPCERDSKDGEWLPIPEQDPRLAIMADRAAKARSFFSRAASGNQKIIEAPHNFHPVVLEEPKAKRKEFPFEGFIDFQGIEIDVENAKGSTRSGKDPSGEEWSIKMHAHYGEIRGTEGTDGDKLDVYVGDNHDSSVVVVIYQHDPDTGAYDEDKVMLGFDSVEEAIGLYKKQYDRPGFFKKDQFLAMPIGQFWRWVNEDENRGKKVRAASASRVAIIGLWNATDGEGELRGLAGLISSLTLYERAIVQDLLVHGVPIVAEGLTYTLRGHVVDPGAVNELLASGYLEETADGIRLSGLFEAKARLYTTSVQRVASRWATKSRSEREDEKTEALVKPSPTKKPPREDLRKRVIDPDKEKDPDEKADTKDTSNNYKDASPLRVASRFARSEAPPWALGKKFTHDDTGNSVNFSSLPSDQQQRLREQHDSETAEPQDEGERDEEPHPDKDEEKAPPAPDEEPAEDQGGEEDDSWPPAHSPAEEESQDSEEADEWPPPHSPGESSEEDNGDAAEEGGEAPPDSADEGEEDDSWPPIPSSEDEEAASSEEEPQEEPKPAGIPKGSPCPRSQRILEPRRGSGRTGTRSSRSTPSGGSPTRKSLLS